MLHCHHTNYQAGGHSPLRRISNALGLSSDDLLSDPTAKEAAEVHLFTIAKPVCDYTISRCSISELTNSPPSTRILSVRGTMRCSCRLVIKCTKKTPRGQVLAWLGLMMMMMMVVVPMLVKQSRSISRSIVKSHRLVSL